MVFRDPSWLSWGLLGVANSLQKTTQDALGGFWGLTLGVLGVLRATNSLQKTIQGARGGLQVPLGMSWGLLWVSYSLQKSR